MKLVCPMDSDVVFAKSSTATEDVACSIILCFAAGVSVLRNQRWIFRAQRLLRKLQTLEREP
jgi:hypothetical protein